jgi:predicted nucleic acid-binding protein
MTLVVDARVAVKWFLQEEGSDAADALLADDASFVVPDLILFEIASVFWRRYRAGDLSRQQVLETQLALPNWFIELPPLSKLSKKAIELPLDLDHHVYDCAYLALAIQRSCDLVTADRKIKLKAERGGFQNVRLL